MYPLLMVVDILASLIAIYMAYKYLLDTRSNITHVVKLVMGLLLVVLLVLDRAAFGWSTVLIWIKIIVEVIGLIWVLVVHSVDGPPKTRTSEVVQPPEVWYRLTWEPKIGWEHLRESSRWLELYSALQRANCRLVRNQYDGERYVSIEVAGVADDWDPMEHPAELTRVVGHLNELSQAPVEVQRM